MGECSYVKNSIEPCENCPKLMSCLHQCELLKETLNDSSSQHDINDSNVKQKSFKQIVVDVWQISNRPFRDYPIGTRAQAQCGGYWVKNEQGWKWCTGDTFPMPGGDWNGMISLSNCH